MCTEYFCFIVITLARWISPIRVVTCTFCVAFLIGGIAVAESGREHDLYGEWEIVEMVYKGKVQDLRGAPGGWIKIEKESIAISDAMHRFGTKSSCVIRQGEIDIRQNLLGEELSLEALYDLNDGKLRIVWRNDYGQRPKHFDAIKDSRLTLYVLTKVIDGKSRSAR